jgi:hypothetical protein
MFTINTNFIRAKSKLFTANYCMTTKAFAIYSYMSVRESYCFSFDVSATLWR